MHTRILTACAAALLAVSAAEAEPIRLDRRDHQREQLDELHHKPVPPRAVASLRSWTGPDPLAGESARGKVVLIAGFASWYSTSHSALTIAQRLHEQHADDGLIVVGVHHQKGWDRAPEILRKRGVTFPVAHDATGDFGKALLFSKGPDYHFIDRAGNLRFADVATRSVAGAAEKLLAETPEQAADAQHHQDTKPPAPDTERTDDTEPSADFRLPDAAEYKTADWPPHNPRVGSSAKDLQGNPLPAQFGNETYLTDKPDARGKILIIDFWATWCGPCRAVMPQLDKLQKQFKDDLVILGISDENKRTVERFLRSNRHDYSQAIDQKGTLKSAFGVRGIPHAVILSSDQTVRWQGHPGYLTPEIIEQFIDADPGVRARRDANAQE